MEKIEESEYKYRTAYLIAFVFVLAMTLIDLALLICGLRGWVEISLLTAGKLFVALLVLTTVTRLAWELYDAQRDAYARHRSQVNA